MPEIFNTLMMPLQLIGAHSGTPSSFLAFLTFRSAIIVLLWQQIGPYSLISLGILLLSFPFAGAIPRPSEHMKNRSSHPGWAGGRMYKLYFDRMKVNDERLKLVNELVNAIRIIKVRSSTTNGHICTSDIQFYAWEKPFRQNIYDTREKDLKILRYFERLRTMWHSFN